MGTHIHYPSKLIAALPDLRFPRIFLSEVNALRTELNARIDFSTLATVKIGQGRPMCAGQVLQDLAVPCLAVMDTRLVRRLLGTIVVPIYSLH